MTPEGRTKKRLKQALDSGGAYHFWPVQSGYGQATIDTIACVPRIITKDMIGKRVGLFFGFETKREGVERPTKRQEQTMKEMRASGATTYLITLDDKGELKWIEIND